MTRLAILADIHGNLQALEAIQRDIDDKQVERVIVAGDSIHWGPSSAEVVDVILREGWAVIRGNNEFYLLDSETPRAPAAWSSRDFRTLLWLRDQLAGERQMIIATWPDALSLRFPDAPAVRVVHGSPRSHWEPMHRDTPVEESYVIAGHTHLSMEREAGKWTIYNPGSAGLPLDGSSAAQYLLLDGDPSGWQPEWRRVEYDHAPLFAAFERSRLVEECGPIGELMIEEFHTNRIQVHAFVVWRNQHHPGEPFSDELLREFQQADRWEYTESAYHVNLDVG